MKRGFHNDLTIAHFDNGNRDARKEMRLSGMKMSLVSEILALQMGLSLHDSLWLVGLEKVQMFNTK